MTDLLDKAQLAEQRFTQSSVSQALSTMAEPPQRIEGGQVFCLACDEPIPAARLAAKPTAAFCITCQQAKERQ